jgi:hypothetical protein
MEIAQQTRLETARREVRSHDFSISLGYSVFAILLLVGIYWGSMAAGTAPGDFAFMTVLP